MNEFRLPQLDPLHPKRHLDVLCTPFGTRAIYDSISFCTRCGSCQQACPTYQLTQEETLSPRGRNQLARLVAEEKLSVKENTDLLQNALTSCLLCGRCTASCAGKIPTAEHVLEMRRTLHKRVLPKGLQQILTYHRTHPHAFRLCMGVGLFVRRWGFVRLLRPFAPSWLKHADDILPKQICSLSKELQKKALTPADTAHAKRIYVPSLEAQFFLPQLAQSVLQTSQETAPTALWTDTASGLFEYVYGDLRQSRRQVKRLLHRWASTGQKPLLTDSIDVFIFWRNAPQLFAKWPRYQKQAEAFAKSLLFITDILPKKPSQADRFPGKIRLDKSALFMREGASFDKAQKTLKTLFKQNFVECLYKDAEIPAFGYRFVRPDLGEKVSINAVRSIARTQTGTVFTLSGLSALELNWYLKQFYPNAKADHLARING